MGHCKAIRNDLADALKPEDQEEHDIDHFKRRAHTCIVAQVLRIRRTFNAEAQARQDDDDNDERFKVSVLNQLQTKLLCWTWFSLCFRLTW